MNKVKLKNLVEAYGQETESNKVVILRDKYFKYIINDLNKQKLSKEDETLVLARLYNVLEGYLNSGDIKNWKKY